MMGKQMQQVQMHCLELMASIVDALAQISKNPRFAIFMKGLRSLKRKSVFHGREEYKKGQRSMPKKRSQSVELNARMILEQGDRKSVV